MGAILAIFLRVERRGDYSQMIMFGPKMKSNFINWLDPGHRPPDVGYIFDVARQVTLLI